MRKINLTLLIIFALSYFLFPGKKDIKFRHITAEQGLSNNQINCIFQDSKGFMWFGTNDGLNKYDGYTFRIYQHDPNDLYSLSSNTIYSICEDKSGSLWIGTGMGLNQYDPLVEKFYHYKAGTGTPNSLSHNFITSIYADKSGTIWIGTNGGGLNKFEPKKYKFYCYKNMANDPNSLSNNFLSAIYEDKSGILWIGTKGGGLNMFDPQKEKFTRYLHVPQNPDSINNNNVHVICGSKSGELWVGCSRSSFQKFNPHTGKFTHYHQDPGNLIHTIYEDQSGILWLGTRVGLKRFDIRTGKLTSFRHNPIDPSSLNYNFITSIYEDRSGILWFGTLGGGLNMSDSGMSKFACYAGNPEVSRNLNYASAFAICGDISGTVWVGTGGRGLYTLDSRGNQGSRYLHNPQDPDSISGNMITALCNSRTGVTWVGCAGAGLDKFNPQTGKFTHYKMDPENPNSLIHNVIFKLYEDRSGILWIGTYMGLNKFDSVKEKFTPYLSRFNKPGRGYKIRAIYEDKRGMLWIGTYESGLYKFDREKEEFTNYKNEPGNPESLSCNQICSILEGHSGMLWIGTEGGGLNKFDRTKGTFISYTRKNGLPNNTIFEILEDDQGNLWLSTKNGLSRFNPAAGTFKNYTPENGLQGYEFHPGAYYKSTKGEMFFAGDNGINAFFPGEIKDNPFIPPVEITAFKVFNRDYKMEKSILETRELELSYNDSFSFEFAALCFSDPERNLYAYKLEEIHEDWIHLGNKREIVFYNLPPGNYTLKVKGSNNDGVWNEQGTAIKITILPPFWQTWWFKVFVLLLLMIGIFYWHRTGMKRQARKLKTEAAKERFFLRYKISDREKEIIYLILRGKSIREMEDELYIATGTVKNHIYNIYKKLSIKNRVQLANFFKNLQLD